MPRSAFRSCEPVFCQAPFDMETDYTKSHSRLLIERIRALCRPMVPQPTSVRKQIAHLKGIRAVLFDVYGTLFVSSAGDIGTAGESANANALEGALANVSLGYEPDRAALRGVSLLLQKIEEAHAQRRHEGIEHPEVDIREIWLSVLSDLAAENLVRNEPTPEAPALLAVEYECRVNPVWPMPELEETLRSLREKGIVLGIVSNAQFFTPLLFPALLDSAAADLGFEESLCVWSYMELEAKPSVRLFRKALVALDRRHGISPEETLYVGNDKLNDLLPAGEAGCRSALFAGDMRSLQLRSDDPRCAAIRPDCIITALPQLADCCE